MNDLIATCGLEQSLESDGVDYKGRNFEIVFSELHASGNIALIARLEDSLFEYFRTLELPNSPTIYDLLVMSLRPKDLIATFNWDPLLWLAMGRNHQWTRGPTVVYLHGNTALGYCPKDQRIGSLERRCSVCGDIFTRCPLLYPISKKDYADDPYISNAWDVLKSHLNHAYILTIFGYSAPETDAEAMKYLRDGWGPTHGKRFSQTEIIDIVDPNELQSAFRPFIHSNHYEVHSNFRESILAHYPRRSCEALWSMFMENHPYNEISIPETDDWNELREWFNPFIRAEAESETER
ncbi:MAG: hypothetical protein KOO62_07665 [candidate division Zixibacteria bacterium]|nr:hypothetical protein [candidate division Zixibacteria bacterium]